MQPLNTRIAPSPTGLLHFGTARTAYFNWLAAKATGGRFLLRIDDTDSNRHNEEAVQVIYDSMEWLGLDYSETFRQRDRTKLYTKVARDLLEAGYAKELDNGAIALCWQSWMPRSWTDELSGEILITDTNIEQIDGRTILTKGGNSGDLGYPTYQFASVVDDYFNFINCIIRGVDHVTNTAKQVAIWSAIDESILRHCPSYTEVPLPKFYHIGLIFQGGKKLSKRDGAMSLMGYKDQGYHPEAIKNFMLRLGWGHKSDDLMDTQEAIRVFWEGRMRNSPAGFDLAKLDSYNRKYKARENGIRKISNTPCA